MDTLNHQPYFYVIMPLESDAQSKIKVEMIQAAAREQGYFAHFPSYRKDTHGFSLGATIKDFERASFVLADLSLERPSCYYELGIAETVGANVYRIAETGTDIHQTSYRNAVRFYSSIDQLKEIVRGIIEQAQQAGAQPVVAADRLPRRQLSL